MTLQRLVLTLLYTACGLGVVQSAQASEVANKTAAAPSLSGSFLSGYVALSSGDTASAQAYLEEAAKADSKNPELLGKLLLLQLTHGDMERAFDTARTLKNLGPHELVVDILLGVEQVKKGPVKLARETFASHPVPQFSALWLPMINAWLDEDSAPLRTAELLPKIKNPPLFLRYHFAAINDMRGHKELSEKGYVQAIEPLAQAPFRALQAYVVNRANAGDKQALRQLEERLKKQRPDVLALLKDYYRFGNALEHLADPPFKPLLSTPAQGVSEVLFTMASLLFALDNTQDVVLYLRMVEYLTPEFMGAKLMLAHALENQNQPEEALEIYSQFKPELPLFLNASIKQAYLLEGRGRADDALNLLAKVQEQFPDATEALVASGDILRSKRKYPEAIKFYGDAIAAINTPQPSDWPVFFARGASYERIGEYAQAEADLQQALKLSPRQPEVLNYLGYMWLTLGEHKEKAFQMLEQAYLLAPDEPAIIDSYAWGHFLNGRYVRAVKLLEKAVDINASDALINEHLGDAYWRVDRRDEARAQWQRALDSSTDSEQQAALKTKLKQGLADAATQPTAETTPLEDDSENKTDLVFE